MKKLFENWRKHLNEGGAKNYGHYEPGRAVADIETGEKERINKTAESSN